MKQSSQLLIDEDPLQVCPSLAVAVGLNEAIALQQLHYWMKRSANERAGRKWVFNNYDEWAKQFPFWSPRTIQRTFLALEKVGIVLTDQPNGQDRRKWYSIDYDKLAIFTDKIAAPIKDTTPSDNASMARSTRQVGIIGCADVARSTRQVGTILEEVSETTPEITSETTTKEKKPSDSPANAVSPVALVFSHWQSSLSHPQAKLTTERERAIRARLKEGYTVESIKQAIDGCRASPFHMGQNERQQRYDDITLICRSGSKLESFITLLEANGNGSNQRNSSPHQQPRKPSLADRARQHAEHFGLGTPTRRAG